MRYKGASFADRRANVQTRNICSGTSEKYLSRDNWAVSYLLIDAETYRENREKGEEKRT